MAANMTITGDHALDRVLAKLPDKIQKKVMKAALRAATKPIIKTARARLAPVRRTGLLAKSIGVVKFRNFPDGNSVARVGARGRYKAPDPDRPGRMIMPQFYSHLVELGTRHSPATPFLRPALKQNKSAAVGAMKKKVEQGIDRQVKRLRGS